MPIVPTEQIAKMKEEQNTIQEVLGGYKGPYLPHVYDNRSECLRANVQEAERQRLAKEGKNIHAQTPEQEKAFKLRQKEAMDKKRKAELATEMLAQAK